MEIQRYKDCGAVFAEDLGSNNSQFTYTGTGITNSPYGRARTFNGNGSNVRGGKVTVNVSGGFTVSGKFNAALIQTQTNPRLFSMYDPSGTLRFEIFLTTSTKTFTCYGIGSNDSHVIRNIDIFSTMAVNDNVWHTYSVVYEGNSTRKYYLYLDGVEDATYTSSYVFLGTTTDAAVNQASANVATPENYALIGYQKEIIVDNRAWSAQEVSDYHYNKVFDYYNQKIFVGYDIGGGTTVQPFDDTIKTNIKNNLKSDGSTPLGLTTIQIADFIKQQGAENL